MIEERHRKYNEEIHINILNRIHNERKKYCESLDKFMMKKKEEERIKKEKAFKKYENFVSFKNI
jgi:polyribonucleotide nucleotidyltransferase